MQIFFALEALWGIARDVDIHAKTGNLDPAQLDEQWILSPLQTLPVPWIWIRALGTAWEKYKTEGGPLGKAFGLEGGQGKPPTIAKLMQMLDERAIARWIWSRVEKLRAAGQEIQSKTSCRKPQRNLARQTSQLDEPGEGRWARATANQGVIITSWK